jgi:hypothetical protein
MLKRFILWDYSRATWQYDVMVALILAFIFLTPREWFRDQPRIPQASIAVLHAETGSSVLWVDLQLLNGVPEERRAARVAEIVRSRTGNKRLVISEVQPVLNSENELLGYMAVGRP